MVTSFNYSLEIASLFVYLTIILIYVQQQFIVNKAHYAFLWLWLFATLTSVANIASAVYFNEGSFGKFLYANDVYYLFQEFTAYSFMVYSLAPLWRLKKVSWAKIALFSLPLISIVLLIVTNRYTSLLFYYDYDAKVYGYGPLQIVVYLVALFYFIFSIYYAQSRKEMYNRHARHAMINGFVIVGLFIIGSLFVPRYLSRGFSISLAMIQILIVTMNSHAKKNPKTGLLNREAFYDWITNLIYNEVPFNVLALRAADFEVLVSTYGLDMTFKLAETIIADLRAYIPVNRGYKIFDDMIYIVYENQTEEERIAIEKTVDDLLARKRNIGGIDIGFSHFIVTFSYPNKFNSIADLRSLTVYFEKMRRMRYGIMNVEEFTVRNLQRENDVEQAIIEAIRDNKFEMFYQPIIDVKTGKYTSAEALIRLNRSFIGPIGPGEFIPIAERTGLIVQIGKYVLDSVFSFIANHDMDALGINYIELNLSVIQCLQRDFIENVTEMVNKHKIDPKRVCFEITETASNCAPELFVENLNAIKKMGFLLAIDDFGTGYGNLHRLITMDFDILKFDRDTTEQTCSDPKVRPIFDKMIKMIHLMNCTVVSEGVETEEQYNFLKNNHIDFIQGYYFSKPINETDYLAFLEEHN